MADTTYTDNVTVITADTMNDLNRLHYTIFSDPADLAAVKTTLHGAPGAIGGVTPAAGSFTTLSASGATTAAAIDMSGNLNCAGDLIMDGAAKQIQALAGSAAAPAVTTSGDLNTGVLFPAADVAAVSTGGTERIRVSASGYVQASNTGTYVGNGTAFHEFCNNGTQNTLFHSSHAVSPGQVTIKFTAASPDDNVTNFFECTDSTTNRLKICSDGDVYNHDNTYGAISDVRFKQDISDASSQWSDVKNLRLRRYRLRSDVLAGKDEPHIGFVADEVQAISPGLVREDKDGFKSLAYSVAYLKLFGAFQEAQSRIELLESRLTTAESRIAAVDARTPR